jgi:UPF0755 protein
VQMLQAEGVAEADWATVLNKASLVEREAKLDEDRPKIARAIDNRLAQSLALQIDSTVSYGLGVTRAPSSAEIADASNAFNTYKHAGLPPTPIASPGQKSIDAVVHPADGTWLYWCTVNLQTGETIMSTTFADQQNAIAQLRAWQAANPNWKG